MYVNLYVFRTLLVNTLITFFNVRLLLKTIDVRYKQNIETEELERYFNKLSMYSKLNIAYFPSLFTKYKHPFV